MGQKSPSDGLTCAVVGAGGGLGHALAHQLLQRPDVASVFALSRRRLDLDHANLTALKADATDPHSLKRAVDTIARTASRIHLLVVCTGILHGGNHVPDLAPEKSLDQLDGDAFREVMTVNALAPLQVIQAFTPLLKHDQRSVVAVLSAMVGSIGDNRIGGWYSYRMSKAALNMGMKNAAIELGRMRPPGRSRPIVVAVHPGTTRTALSRPFLSRHDARAPEQSAQHILEVLDGLSDADNGRFFNWDGRELPW